MFTYIWLGLIVRVCVRVLKRTRKNRPWNNYFSLSPAKRTLPRAQLSCYCDYLNCGAKSPQCKALHPSCPEFLDDCESSCGLEPCQKHSTKTSRQNAHFILSYVNYLSRAFLRTWNFNKLLPETDTKRFTYTVCKLSACIKIQQSKLISRITVTFHYSPFPF